MKNTLRIIFVLIAISTMLYFVFSEKESKEILDFDDLYEQTYKFELPDTLGPSIWIKDLLAIGDSLIFFSEGSTNLFYLLNRKVNAINQITNQGLGPGEFQMPRGVILDGDYITLTGAVKPVISYFDLQGNFVKDIKSGSQFGLGNIIKYKDSYIKKNGFSSSNYFNFVHDSTVFYPIPDKLKQSKGIHFQDPGAFIHQDILYFMNPYESIIHRYDLKKNDILEEIIIPDLLTAGYNIGNETKTSSRFIYTKGSFIVTDFRKVLINNRLYFYVNAFLSSKDEEKRYHKILDFKAKPYIQFNIKDSEIYYSDENRFIVQEFEFENDKSMFSDRSFLVEYRLKDR